MSRERRLAHLAEAPIAQLMAITCNVNRDPSKTPKPFTMSDFLLYGDKAQKSQVFDGATVAAALSLRNENRCPAIIITVWPQLMEAAGDAIPLPSVRALTSADESVWVLAPSWQGRDIRGGLVAVRGPVHGAITLHDIDRPLNRYTVVLPKRAPCGWLEARTLLIEAAK